LKIIAEVEQANLDIGDLHSDIALLDKSIGDSALPPVLVDAFARGLGDGGSEEADALRAAMAHIKNLNKRLSVAGARVAASILADERQRSGGKNNDVSDDDEDLKLQIKDLKAEIDDLKHQLDDTTHAGGALARALRDHPDGKKNIREYFVANPRRIVVIPMFFTAARPSDNKTQKVNPRNLMPPSKLGDEASGEGEEGDDVEEEEGDFKEEAITPGKDGLNNRSHSVEDERDMQGWAQWQIHDDDEGFSEEEEEETDGSTKMRRIPKSGEGSLSGKGPLGGERQPRAPSATGRLAKEPVDKKGSRARHSQPPLDLSPLAKYLKVWLMLISIFCCTSCPCAFPVAFITRTFLCLGIAVASKRQTRFVRQEESPFPGSRHRRKESHSGNDRRAHGEANLAACVFLRRLFLSHFW
jgi:hypothetical protein